jgi:hypothetical protein
VQKEWEEGERRQEADSSLPASSVPTSTSPHVIQRHTHTPHCVPSLLRYMFIDVAPPVRTTALRVNCCGLPFAGSL